MLILLLLHFEGFAFVADATDADIAADADAVDAADVAPMMMMKMYYSAIFNQLRVHDSLCSSPLHTL